jgi:hypothetical protein
MVVEIGLGCVHQIQMSRILVRTSEPCVEQRPTGDRSFVLATALEFYRANVGLRKQLSQA